MNYDLLFSLLASFALAFILGPRLIPFMTKLKFGQTIREEGPESHQAKAGTPTMGGFLIILGFLFAVLITGSFSMNSLIVVLSIVLFGLIGFIDDFIKVVMKQNLGLRAYQKVILQLIFGAVVVMAGYYHNPDILIPFTGLKIQLGVVFIPLMILYFMFVSNAVNLTDGLDGLASGVTVVVGLFLTAAALKLGSQENAVLSLALVGATLAFLYYNRHPAKIFMGDTGSLAIGGALCGITMNLGLQFMSPVFGMIFLVEALSVILQVASFKTRGKRIFKMSPLHHHYELSGWSEEKVVKTFWAVSVLFGVIAWFMI